MLKPKKTKKDGVVVVGVGAVVGGALGAVVEEREGDATVARKKREAQTRKKKQYCQY